MVVQAAHAQRLPEFLDTVKAGDIFPGADRLGPAEGKPMAARAYAGDRQLGYVYLTTDIVNTRGYSSKPIDTLVAIANSGEIVGAKLVQHHEPIVLIGIPQAKVDHFIQGYVGMNFVDAPPRHGSPTPVDIVSGATVTMMVIGDSITRSAIGVARAYGIGKAPDGAAQAAPAASRVVDQAQTEVQSWDALLASGALRNLHLTVSAVNKAFEETGRQGAIDHPEPGDPDDDFVDLYVALVSVPSIGRSLLGDAEWKLLRERLQPGQQAVLVAGNGSYSFKGSGYVRGGIFDRIEVIQNESSFRFRDRNHQRLADLAAQGAPGFKEIALFVVPEDAALDPISPWRLQLMVQRVISVKDKAFVTFDLDYELPRQYTMADPAASAAPAPASAQQAADGPPAAAPGADAAAAQQAEFDTAPPIWRQIWRAKTGQISAVLAALLLLVGVFFFQDQLTSRPVFYDRFRLAFLTFTLFWLGWYGQAQLSVVNVLTFTSALRSDFRWEYFLMDPVVFILWCATAISMVFWNRGAFCGWLCPFGALQELTNRIAKRLGVKQITISYMVNQRLSTLKYVIFLVLFAFSLYELSLAEQLAEVEPFKTAIILRFMRYWPFVLFAVLLLLAGLFIERFFCRYLCPLGAALAIPARLRVFNWLRRYRECGNPCQRCNIECPVQAINPEGDINPNECIQCLHCQMLYHHEQKCPHLIQKNARRQKQHKAPPPSAMPGETIVRFIPAAPTVKERQIETES
ncbi:4Fe-4S binding protein [Pollutimonas bauzanensis]|uniref:4Fe-4S binding protein n=1 Tax=Pollutimonas bauzanensis TaxID=658167 RepID=UPI003CCB8387